ncbi:MAG: acyl-CoA dehydratase activase-related protein [Candidatus Muiribacteriota bacterium]
MKKLKVGLDIGSTTLKVVVVDSNFNIIFKKYLRHYSEIKKTVFLLFDEIKKILKNKKSSIAITGSAGLGFAQKLNIPFVQEVIASTKTIKKNVPHTDVAIELGGEDAKIIYLGNQVEQRMNGTCAGGTGSFIDQMATLLKTDPAGLNKLAGQAETIHPIASRCGVFAKTDVQTLLNEGVSREDIAASIFQAVVNQTITALSQGKPIRGKVAFLGGPLYFLSELRKKFIKTLKLKKEDIIFPENSQYYVALGAALSTETSKKLEFECLYDRMPDINIENNFKKNLTSLFLNEKEYKTFRDRHYKNRVVKKELSAHRGKCFLGIDAGSTTTKLALIDKNGNLLYSAYGNNHGKPLNWTVNELKKLYLKMNPESFIANAAVTGYGEKFLKNALNIDLGEIETIAHYKGADFFCPGVDFVLDIGGQDMKSLKIKNKVITSIMLNEACSSGCGSFIETFAHSLNMKVKDFALKGLEAKNPVDLGSRCTVFMNSKVKQVQKEGADISDISAGVSKSIIKNALFKVIRMKNPEELGKKIVVQGGTFYNEAVLRSIEKILNREVIRPNIAGIMGAFGAALIASEKYREGKSSILSTEELHNFDYTISKKVCNLCNNNCKLIQYNFWDGHKYITGNRCERAGQKSIKKKNDLNIYYYKLKKVFDYKSLENPTRGEIGIPRVLNMYEDFPFWHTFFTQLGYKVKLSSPSSKKIYEKGIETIPSESICYPAKLVHGHIMDLIHKKVKKIFYPCIPLNQKEDKNACGNYNCPVVVSYPETIYANIRNLRKKDITFYKPFLPLNNPDRMLKRLKEELKNEKIPMIEMKNALQKAYEDLKKYKEHIKLKGSEILKIIQENNMPAIVLAGRPYHIDPEINKGIPELIRSMGYAVLSEDSVSHQKKIQRPLRTRDQWTYHTRLYAAAEYVATKENIQLVQLNSFGCGLDAITSDQIKEILEKEGKIFTLLKIDEITNLGAARIRLRSLNAALNEIKEKKLKLVKTKNNAEKIKFTKKMRKKHTILIPHMSPIHFQFFKPALKKAGYKAEILPGVDKKAIDIGLKYVNNDSCYPAIIVIGQIIEALESGKYDINNTSVIISQTGGGCRASNYISLLRKGLKDAGYDRIPVISASAQGFENHPGFKFTPGLLHSLIFGILTGDLLMKLLHKTRPYEKEKGKTEKICKKWEKIVKRNIEKGGLKEFRRNIKNIIKDFEKIEIDNRINKTKVGIVGEIFVKFSPTANNNLVKMLEEENIEVIIPDLYDFFLYPLYNLKFNKRYLEGTLKSSIFGISAIKILEIYRNIIRNALKKSQRYSGSPTINQLAGLAENHLSIGNQTGEGWLLTAEMVKLIKSGVKNILCLQPFACLPNHITGKGMITELRNAYPETNIAPIDYDPGASEVNQLNRIKLLIDG